MKQYRGIFVPFAAIVCLLLILCLAPALRVQASETTAETGYLLINLPNVGDQVVLYNSGWAMTFTNQNGYLEGERATVAGNTLVLTDTMAKLTVGKSGDYYTFTADGMYLTSPLYGNGLFFQKDLSDQSMWTITAASSTNSWEILNKGASYNGRYNQAINLYSGTFSTYGMTNSGTYHIQMYGLNFEDNPHGECGEDLQWSLDQGGCLTITGTGKMKNYRPLVSATAPWYVLSDKIKTVVIDNRVTNIGAYAFYGCSEITEVNIPDSATDIGTYAFGYCSGITELNLPDSVTNIGTYAFYNCSRITKVNIPDSVTDISAYAFDNCSGITELNLPDSVTNIGAYAFYQCSGITELNLPDSVTEIGDHAFYGCSGLTGLTIPRKLKNIGDEAFACCRQLEIIQVDSDNRYYTLDDKGCLYNRDKSRLLFIPLTLTDLKIPNTISTIEKSLCARKSNLISVTIPDSVTRICKDAFNDCSNLREVTIGKNVKAIDSCAFQFCSKLKNVYIFDATAWSAISFETSTSNPMVYADNGYILDKNGNEVREVTITDQKKTVPSYCFRNFRNITTVTIPDNITTITTEAFYNCLSLKTVTMSSQINTIQANVFRLCKALENVYYAGTEADWDAINIFDYNQPLLDAAIHYGHIHSYTMETVDPTCTEQGYTRYICSAGEIENGEFVPAIGHEMGTKLDQRQPTCTEKGYSEYLCSRCNMTYWELFGTPIGHSFTIYTSNGDGTKTSKCDRCDTTNTKADDGNYVPLAITKQPQSLTLPSGTQAQFAVEATGNVVEYRWQYRKIYKWFDTTMEGYNTNTLILTATGTRNNYGYRCLIKYSDGTVLISETAVLTVETDINIVKAPSDQVVAVGYKGQFTVKAVGEALRYQWQYCRPDSAKWIDTTMEGCTKQTVMIETTKARNGYMYRCRITDAAGKVVYTDAATLRALTVQTQPADQLTAPETVVTFTVIPSVTDGVSYQWQYRKSGGAWTNTTMTGYNTQSLQVPATLYRNGYQYRCVLTGAKNSCVESNAATLFVGSPVVIKAHPESRTLIDTASVTFTVEATDVHSYQWQISFDGTTWYNSSAAGSKSNSITTVAKGKDGYQYRCKITGLNGLVYYTNVATLTVVPEPRLEIMANPYDRTVPAERDVKFAVLVDGTVTAWQWQYTLDGETWLDAKMDGADTNILTVIATVELNGAQFRCVISGQYDMQIITTPATLTVQ